MFDFRATSEDRQGGRTVRSDVLFYGDRFLSFFVCGAFGRDTFKQTHIYTHIHTYTQMCDRSKVRVQKALKG